MKCNHLLRAVTAATVLATASLSASAGLVVLDGWQLVTPTINITNIGRLNLVSGTATVQQEVNAANTAFVGAKFSEFGSIFSLSYTKENVVGAGDTGSPLGLGETLTLAFTNVLGHVTALNAGGGFKYVFDSGSLLLSGASGNYASGSIIGIGGNLSATAIVGGVNGDSTLLASIGAILNASFDLKDSLGASLKPDLLAGKVLFEGVTNNNTTSSTGFGACTFTPLVAGDRCQTFSVASAGDGYLLRNVPEPGSIALFGLGLMGLAAMRRRKSVE